jgi:hypothetical protein
MSMVVAAVDIMGITLLEEEEGMVIMDELG